eukprot:scaffold4916_cov28-Tisochrysis_lutea.AAC.1
MACQVDLCCLLVVVVGRGDGDGHGSGVSDRRKLRRRAHHAAIVARHSLETALPHSHPQPVGQRLCAWPRAPFVCPARDSASHSRRHGQWPPCPHAPHDHATPRTGSMHTAQRGEVVSGTKASPPLLEPRGTPGRRFKLADALSDNDDVSDVVVPPIRPNALHRFPSKALPPA